MDSKKIKVWAHRGASGYAPENTMDAFRKAIEMKADGIELFMGVHKNQEDVLLPDEPVDVASMLINATITVEPGKFGALSPLHDKEPQTFAKYDTNHLQEIAEHLLVYCEAQERGCVDACCKDCEP